jgi:plasmid stabilization system protein ParE
MKIYEVYLMPDAIKDLEHIYEYISAQIGFPKRAWAYIEGLQLHQGCRTISSNVGTGGSRHFLMMKIINPT